MTAFILKIIALLTMFADHIGATVPHLLELDGGTNILRVVGRVSFPIFVYLIAEGFRHTKNPSKFLLRLGIFAIISEPFFDMSIQYSGGINFFSNTNIFYTLFLGGLAIVLYQKLMQYSNVVVSLIPVAVCLVLAEFLTVDYGGYGVLFIFLMYAIKPEKLRLLLMLPLSLWQHAYTIEFLLRYRQWPFSQYYLLMIPATMLPVFLIVLYNGKRGIGMKWLFYAAYPAHLAILAFIVYNTPF